MADLSGYWAKHPPLQTMVQAYLGIGAKDGPEDDAEFDAAVASMGPQG